MRKHASLTPLIEALDRRQLLSSVMYSSGNLVVNGTGGKDTINFSLNGTTVKVTDGVHTLYNGNPSSLKTIVINAGPSNDRITVTTSTSWKKTFDVWGGSGNDSITLNTSQQVFAHGGSGDDSIYVTGGAHDIIRGDEDNDKITVDQDHYTDGLPRETYVNGGRGNDTIWILKKADLSADGGEGGGQDVIYASKVFRSGNPRTTLFAGACDGGTIGGGASLYVDCGNCDVVVRKEGYGSISTKGGNDVGVKIVPAFWNTEGRKHISIVGSKHKGWIAMENN